MNMNKEGFMLVELLVSIIMVSFFLFTLIKVPVELTGNYTGYIQTAREFSDEGKLKASILSDLQVFGAKEENGKLIIGDEKTYTFSEDGVYRKSNETEYKITNSAYDFLIEGNTLIVKKDKKTFKYIINSSFKDYSKRGVVNE